jgi:pSer/pThr/pTyr-binding forkhead associated (FHA) protein
VPTTFDPATPISNSWSGCATELAPSYPATSEKDLSGQQPKYWCEQGIHIDRAGPEGLVSVELRKPFALIGKHRRADLVLSGSQIVRRHLYLHATDAGVFCIDLAKTHDSRPLTGGWIDSKKPLEIGAYQLRIRATGDFQESPDDQPDLLTAQSGDPPFPTIILSSNGHHIGEHRLTRRLTVVGRHESCSLRLASKTLSDFHCVFYREGDQLWVIDLRPRNALFVDHNKVETALMQPDSVLRVGRVQVEFRFDETNQKPRTNAPFMLGPLESAEPFSLTDPDQPEGEPPEDAREAAEESSQEAVEVSDSDHDAIYGRWDAYSAQSSSLLLKDAQDGESSELELYPARTEQSEQACLEIERLQSKLEKREQGLVAQQQELDAQQRGFNVRHAELNEQRERFEKDCIAWQEQRNAVQEQDEKVQRDLQELRRELATVETHLSHQKEELEAKQEQLLAESDKLNADREDFEVANTKSDQELESRQANLDTRSRELEAATIALARKHDEQLKQLNQQESELKAALNDLDERNRHVSLREQRLEQRKAELAARQKCDSQEATKLKSELDALHDQLQATNERAGQIDADNQQLRDKLLELERASKNVTSPSDRKEITVESPIEDRQREFDSEHRPRDHQRAERASDLGAETAGLTQQEQELDAEPVRLDSLRKQSDRYDGVEQAQSSVIGNLNKLQREKRYLRRLVRRLLAPFRH